MSMGLKKAVLIVGGTSDIGQAICRRFSQSTLPLIMTYQKNRKVAFSDNFQISGQTKIQTNPETKFPY